MLCRLNMMTKIEQSRKETQCGDVVMKKEMEGRMGWGRSNVDRSLVLVNGEEREFKPKPYAQMEVGEEAVLEIRG